MDSAYWSHASLFKAFNVSWKLIKRNLDSSCKNRVNRCKNGMCDLSFAWSML